jgi:hypothetical protein
VALPVPQEVAMQVINSVIFSLIVFYTVRLQGQYAVFWLVYLITSCVGISALPDSTYSLGIRQRLEHSH